MTFICAWLLADLITGFAHWVEDRLLTKPSRFSFINVIRSDNERHHLKPAEMLKLSYWENINTTVAIAWPLALCLWLAGAPTVVWLAVFIASFANLIHRFAHTPNPHWIIWVLQDSGVLLSFKQHMQHHVDSRGILTRDESNRRYCSITGWLNPILDKLQVWRVLNRIAGIANDPL